MAENNSLLVTVSPPLDPNTCQSEYCLLAQKVLTELAELHPEMGEYYLIECNIMDESEKEAFPTCNEKEKLEIGPTLDIWQAPVKKSHKGGTHAFAHFNNIYDFDIDKVESIYDHMVFLYPSFIRILNNVDTYKKFQRSLQGRSKIQFMNDKLETPFYLKRLSTKYKDQIAFAEIKAPTEDGIKLFESLGMTAEMAPSFYYRFYNDEDDKKKSDFSNYTGTMDYDELNKKLEEGVREYKVDIPYLVKETFNNWNKMEESNKEKRLKNMMDLSYDQTSLTPEKHEKIDLDKMQLIHVYHQEPNRVLQDSLLAVPQPIKPMLCNIVKWREWCIPPHNVDNPKFCMYLKDLVGKKEDCKLVFLPPGKSLQAKLRDGRCITKKQEERAKVFSEIHRIVTEIGPLDRYDEDRVDKQIVDTLVKQDRMLVLCLSDRIAGIPWEILALNNDTFFQQHFRFGYIINPSMEILKHMGVNGLDMPIYVVAQQQQQDWLSNIFFNVKRISSAGFDAFTYDDFTTQLKNAITQKDEIKQAYITSLKPYRNTSKDAQKTEYFYYQIGNSSDDFGVYFDCFKRINFRFELNGFWVDTNCHTSLRKRQRLDSESGYIIHYNAGDSNVQLLEIDYSNHDEWIKNKILNELRKRKINLSISVKEFQGNFFCY